MPRRAHGGLVRSLGLVVALLVLFGLPLSMPAEANRSGETPLIGPASGVALHVMSFNLRFASDRMPNSWPRRRPAMAELLGDEQPTVLGTQEGLYGQVKDIEDDLPERYDWIGEGRGGGSHDEFVAIFFDTRRLEPLAYDHFWLSDTPGVVASNTWGNSVTRMVTWVRFADRRTGAEFVVVNTHLDDQSAYARRRGAELLRDRINAFPPGLPVVLTGDFNAPAGGSDPYQILTGAGMTDSWTAAADRRTPAYATWHAYRPLRDNGRRIDWILTKGPVTVAAAGINAFARDGQRPSDHLPVQTLLTLG